MPRQLPAADPNDTKPLQQWQRHPLWRGFINTDFMDLLEGDSDLSRAYPHLYEVFWNRFNETMDARNGDPISKCDDLYPDGHTGRSIRADSELFQRNYSNNNARSDHESQDTAEERGQQICDQLRDRIDIRAAIGSGAYGSVFLAIEKHDSDSRYDRHYVVKVETHNTMRNRAQHDFRPTMTAIPDEDDDVHFIPLEALLLLLTTPCPHFTNLDSVYVDAEAHSIVMGACVDHDILKTPELHLDDRPPPTFRGRFLKHEKKPLVNELQSCKIASQLLEGFIYLWDMNITHSDLSQNNFLVDEELNVRIIDLGMMHFGYSSNHFRRAQWAIVGVIEALMTPELAIELTKDHWRTQELIPGNTQVDVLLPHNAAIDDYWRLSSIIYSVLHGFAPWESPDYDHAMKDPGHGLMEKIDGEYEKMIFERRHRIINEELPIGENLSQDCADALRMMLCKKPLERASPFEMCAIPWFNQYAPYMEHMAFLRPRSIPYDELRESNGFEPAPDNMPRPERQ